ncbi:MAG: hypothetical protein AB7O32_00180 [Vicinamibacterales bacterium]
MADVYLDYVNGSNANGGTSLVDAWKSPLAAGWSSIANGSRIILRGDEADLATHFRPADLSELLTFQLLLSGKSNITIIPYDDRGYVIRGDVVLNPASWSNVSGTIYKQNIGTNLIAASGNEGKQLGVTFDYDDNTVTLIPGYPAAHYGILEAGTSSTVAVGESWYDRTSGDLFINVGADPALGVVTVSRGKSDSLIKWAACSGIRQFGGVGKLCSLHNTTVGYIHERNGCSDCLLSDFRAYDGGYHNIGGIGSGNVRNTVRSCYAEGGGNTGTHFVEYATSGTHSGVRVADCVALVRTHLLIDGTPRGGSGAVQAGFFCHYGTGQNNVNDLEFRRCGTQCYVGTSPNIHGWGGVDVGTFSGSRYSRDGRPVRYIDCWSRGDTYMTVEGPQYFLRCDFRFTNAGPLGAASSTGCVRFGTDGGGTSKRGIPLFEACLIIGNMDNGSAQYFCRAQGNTYFDDGSGEFEGPTFVGCTVADLGTGTNRVSIFDYQDRANFKYAAFACLAGFTGRGGTNAYICYADSTANAAKHEFADCHLFGYTAGKLSLNTSFDTQAEWTSTIDAAGKHTASGAGIFRDTSASSPVAARPSAAAIAGVRFTPAPGRAPVCDVWGRPFAGQHGCWQEQPGDIRGFTPDRYSFRRSVR